MTLKILHTADIHIGMKFSNYPAGIREELVEARFKVLQDLILKANQVKTDLFIITGDLFERINISEKDILRTIKILENFSGYFVLIIPGNHDYDNGMVELWSFFKKNISKKIKVLNEYKAFSLNIQLTVTANILQKIELTGLKILIFQKKALKLDLYMVL